MTKHKITNDQNDTFTIDNSNDSWVFASSATISVADLPALDVEGDHNTIRVDGRLLIDRETLPKGEFNYAVTLNGDDTLLTNNGAIRQVGTAAMNAILANGSATITNTGDIIGYDAIQYTADSSALSIVNGEDGVIKGRFDAIGFLSVENDVFSTTKIDIVNDGLIFGDIRLERGNDHLTNHGTITGSIWLDSGNDVVDMRGGTFLSGTEGTPAFIDGGKGNDTLYTDRKVYSFLGGNGNDTVYASSSFVLADSTENLYLTGDKNVSGTGSGDANHISGNSGNNILSGGGALADSVDVLSGGKGRDVFLFNTESTNDVITDYKDGVDKIHIDGIDGLLQYSQLSHRITQVGDDVLITISKSDHLSITLEHTAVNDIGASDFMFN